VPAVLVMMNVGGTPRVTRERQHRERRRSPVGSASGTCLLAAWWTHLACIILIAHPPSPRSSTPVGPRHRGCQSDKRQQVGCMDTVHGRQLNQDRPLEAVDGKGPHQRADHKQDAPTTAAPMQNSRRSRCHSQQRCCCETGRHRAWSGQPHAGSAAESVTPTTWASASGAVVSASVTTAPVPQVTYA